MAHTRTHARTHTYTNTHTRTHARTHTHTHLIKPHKKVANNRISYVGTISDESDVNYVGMMKKQVKIDEARRFFVTPKNYSQGNGWVSYSL